MMPTKTDSLRYDIRELMKSGGFSEIVDRCHLELTMARRESRHTVEIIALLGLAQAQCSLGHFAFARDYIDQAIEGAETVHSVSLVIDALNVRARIAREGFFKPPKHAKIIAAPLTWLLNPAICRDMDNPFLDWGRSPRVRPIPASMPGR